MELALAAARSLRRFAVCNLAAGLPDLWCCNPPCDSGRREKSAGRLFSCWNWSLSAMILVFYVQAIVPGLNEGYQFHSVFRFRPIEDVCSQGFTQQKVRGWFVCSHFYLLDSPDLLALGLHVDLGLNIFFNRKVWLCLHAFNFKYMYRPSGYMLLCVISQWVCVYACIFKMALPTLG